MWVGPMVWVEMDGLGPLDGRPIGGHRSIPQKKDSTIFLILVNFCLIEDRGWVHHNQSDCDSLTASNSLSNGLICLHGNGKYEYFLPTGRVYLHGLWVVCLHGIGVQRK